MKKLCLLAAGLFAAYGASAAYQIPVVNGSFETVVPNPGTAQVRGFDNGKVAGSGSYDTTGWHDIVPVMLDSGTEQGGYGASNKVGVRNAYFMAANSGTNDAGAYQIINHTIAAGDEFVLNFQCLNIWNGSVTGVELFYGDTYDAANVITNYTDAQPWIDWNGTDLGWWGSTYKVYALTSSVPAEAIGSKLGIRLWNAANLNNDSWLAFDNVSLYNLAVAPFIVTDTYPAAGSTDVTNPVVVSTTFVDDESTYDSATVYLDGWATTIGNSVSSLNGTNTLTTSIDPQTFDPLSAHTVHIVINGVSPTQSITNDIDFVMNDQFDITVTPEDGGYSLAYDYMPVVTAQIIQRNDAISFPTLYINGSEVSTSDSLGVTSTVEYAFTSPIAAGSNITCQLIVTGVDYGDQTNNWSFTMGGDVGVTIWGTNDPSVDADDQYLFDVPAADAENLSTDDAQTYVSGDRPAQGQFFTTPNVATAYEVDSIWLRHTSYDAGSTGVGPGGLFRVRIVDPAQSNTVNFVRYESTTNMVVLNDSLVTSDGRWVQFKLEKPVVLKPNTKYGFDVGSPNPWFDTCGVAVGGYAGGEAYSSGSNGSGNDIVTSRIGDRTFMVKLNTSTADFIFTQETPKGADAPNPVTLSSTFEALNGSYSSADLYLNGNLQASGATGSNPYTIDASVGNLPLQSTNTAMVVVNGTESNSWEFVMAGGFKLVNQVPAAGDFLFTNDTPISVDVVNFGDTLSAATMYLDVLTNTAVIATSAGGSATNNLGVSSSGILDPGDHTIYVVTDGATSGLNTNSWTFGIAGGAGIYMWGTTDPVPGADDLSQFLSSGGNVNGDASDHESNYIAGNRPVQGQLFATTNGTGFTLSSVWVKLSDFATGGGNIQTGINKLLRITDPGLTNSDFFVVHQELLTVKNTVGNGFDPDIANQWLQFKLATPIVLAANKQYGFDIANGDTGDSWFQLAGISTDPYTDGSAYNSSPNGVGSNIFFTTNTPGDRTFMVELEGGAAYVPFNPFSITKTPVGATSSNVTVTATIANFEETLATAELYVDGVLESNTIIPGGSGTNSITASATYAPLSSHQVMLITTGSEYPSAAFTNTWSFAIATEAPGAVISWSWDNAGTVDSTNFAGLYAVSNWNSTYPDHAPGAVGGYTASWTNLADNAAAATTADAAWELGSNEWGYHVIGWHPGLDANGTANKEMLNGYLDAFDGSNSVINLSQIPFTSYDIVVYFSSDVGGRVGSVTDGATTYTFKTVGNACMWEDNALLQQATAGTTNVANYAVFSGLSGASQTITVAPDYSDWNGMGISGFQIVDMGGGGPVPTTLSISIPAGGPITISWPVADGAGNVYTNSDLVNGPWGLYGAGSVNGSNYEVNIPLGAEQQLFIKAE